MRYAKMKNNNNFHPRLWNRPDQPNARRSSRRVRINTRGFMRESYSKNNRAVGPNSLRRGVLTLRNLVRAPCRRSIRGAERGSVLDQLTEKAIACPYQAALRFGARQWITSLCE